MTRSTVRQAGSKTSRPVAPASLGRRQFSALLASFAGLAAFPQLAQAAARGSGATGVGAGFGPAAPFSWDTLVRAAQALAARPYVQPPVSAHAAADFEAAVKLTYGDAKSVAGDVRLFPATRGTSPQAVKIHLVENGSARELTDTRGFFVGGSRADPAGFRVMTADHRSDWLAFQGASYFRTSGARDQYGLSARGIAVDTAMPHPEEFPAFTEFWIEHVGTDHVRIHALLDGPSVTGAYAFDCLRGEAAITQDVRASLFLRRDVARLGLAPITSMFWYDQSDPAKRNDWRPEIHDSDGLAIHAGSGERIWVPLANPQRTRTNALRADGVKGFGLLQRDQSFDHYQDDGAFYDKRPSLWVEPQGDWGKGAVMLYQMSTDTETIDNIAAFWLSDEPARAGQRRDLAYRLSWTSKEPGGTAAARCVDSWQGQSGRPGVKAAEKDARKFVFDFEGEALQGLTRQSGVTAETGLPAQAVVDLAVYPVVGTPNRWRVVLDLRPAAMPSPDIRLFLARGGAALSETVIQSLEP
ncbi:glucan biosynthesis protein [Novosphingobium sp. KA1]|uniref:glucan biosynthesis protein n=1 Tax=Novosphingobium sp. (strain KA1) TaxID=164608 RepID=UPI001A8C6863|nr:glucan biosynthesis protein [Novosphingobium sp. KA1]QSR17754.1 glucan biosynthesis protein D [Novosphingobium sp. KA1]